MIPVWLLTDPQGNTITTDKPEQKASLVANGWRVIAMGAHPEHSHLDELVEWEKQPTSH